MQAEKSKLNCEYCPLSYNRRDSLNSHIRTFHKICFVETCKRKFDKPDNLDRHLYKEHNIDFLTWYTCKKCNYESYNLGNLKRHRANVHNQGFEWYDCDKCDFFTKEKKTLMKHKKNYHSVTVHVFECGKYKTDTKQNFIEHHIQDHPDKKGLIFCHICSFVSINQQSLPRHYLRKHGLKTNWEDLVNIPEFLEHNPVVKQKRLGGDLSCYFCTFTTNNANSLRRHVKRFHPDNPF